MSFEIKMVQFDPENNRGSVFLVSEHKDQPPHIAEARFPLNLPAGASSDELREYCLHEAKKALLEAAASIP